MRGIDALYSFMIGNCMTTETEEYTTPDVLESSTPPDRDWRAIVCNRWNSLGQEVLGTTPARSLRLKDVATECELITAVVAWFMNDGNITLTAESLRSNRKSVRDRISRWRERYPHLVPPALADSPTCVGKRSSS